jgi:hypothetical protein
LPAGLLLGVTAVALRCYGVPLSTTVLFGAYIAFGITLPGLLLWRVTHRRCSSIVEDAAAGVAVGYALETLTYLPARAVGAPALTLAVQAFVLVAFAAVPGLRRYWRSPGPAGGPPLPWCWAMAGLLGLILLWSCTKFYRYQFLHWPDNAFGGTSDMPFHLALLGEAKHHMPMVIPFVAGEPLLYHWFVYAEMAATSWATGIEPQVLLYRLSLLPMLAGFTLVIAVIARRLTRVWWTGPVAGVVTFLVLAPNPYGWKLPPFFDGYLGFGVVDDASLLRPVLWSSPTQTFGALLFAPVVLLLIDLLTGHGRDLRRWLLFGGLLIAVMGAKATYLPLLLSALGLVVLVHLRVHRLHRPALIAASFTLVCLLFAQFVLFGGATQGLRLDPFDTMKVWAMSDATGFATGAHPSVRRLLLLTALFLACWACIWGGIAGLGRHVVEPPFILLTGLGIGGAAAITLLGHAGLSQGFFFQSARPYLAIAAVAGLAVLVPAMTWRNGLTLLGAAGAGAAVVVVIRAHGSPTVPGVSAGARRVAVSLTVPYLLIAAAATVVGLAVWGFCAVRHRALVRHRAPASHRAPAGLAGAVVVAMLAGGGLTTGFARFRYAIASAQAEGWLSSAVLFSSITKGAQVAGRWLRDHSGPDDLVATNAHCASPGSPVCDNGHTWIAAYSERRVLVEGWGYTDQVHARALTLRVPEGQVPYWHPDVLADNDAAFAHPSHATIGRLRDKYHVRWLFVDETEGRPPAALAEFASLRYRSGNCAIYQIAR